MLGDFFKTLLSTPPGEADTLSRYTQANGMFYMALGLGIYAFPALAARGLLIDSLQGIEEGMLSVMGFLLVVVGWFYLMGGRTRAPSFALATVVDRFLIPAFLLPLGFSGALPLAPMVIFSILDPALALGALLIWAAQRRRQAEALSG